MKVWRKVSVFLAMLVLCAGMINMPVSAASDTQDGLKVTLTTDKDTYSQSDEIKVNISVENTNSFDVNNVSLESIIPDGLELKKDYSSSATIGTLTAGDSYKCELVLQQRAESVPVEDNENVDSEDSGEGTSTTENQSSQTSTSIDKNSINQNEKANESDSVQTGDFTSILPVSIVLVVSAIIIIFLLHKKRNRIFMFFLGIVGSALLFNNGVIDSKAAETVNQRNISVNEIIQVGDNKYELQVNVNYESINDQDDEDSEIIQLTIDQGDFTTVDNIVTLSGTYTGDVTEITYENIPGDQSYGEISRGKVAFSNNKWSFELNVLEIGENNISIIAVDSKGNNTTVSVRIIKEGLYRYSQDDIVTDGETGVSYIRNTIIIFFEDNISPVRENEIVNSISGEIIGKDSFIDEVFVRVPQTDFAGLNGIVEQLENTEGVLTASLDLASSVDVCGEYDTIYPSDGSTNYEDKATWYNEIKASSLSKYQTNSINVGVVDVGFDYWHRDLTLKNISALNSLSEKDHGTHVAGIIGAKHNNFGINGILKKCNIYCYDAVPEGYQTEYKVAHSYLIHGLVQCVENDARVINYSLTTNNETQDDLTQEEKDEQATYFSKYIYALRNKNKDFLIVQAAGNGHAGFWNITGRDATNTGAFACITEDNCYSGEAVSKEEILDSIIIVGNAEMVDGKYQLALSSNGGARVDITAPGTNIFSTVENGFGYMSGTSMASPMVTAAAAGIWSMDESLSAAQVKDILLTTADAVVSSNPDAPNAADNGRSTYTFLNIADAVNYVLDAMSGTVSGKVVQEDQSPLNYVLVEVYAENGDRVESGYTDKNGMFTFDLTEGMYEIHFAKSGFDNKKMSINIRRGEITALLDPIVMNAKSVGIQGTVVDETGSAISDVNVEIKDSNSDEDITTTTTDENGEFFVALENGEYKITFTKEGYESVIKDNIIVFDGTFTMRNIVLSKNQDTTLLKGKYIAARHGNVAAILSDGSLWTWGSNGRGQLGNGTFVDSSVPVKIMDNVVKVSIGYEYMAAIKTDGSLWTWGGNAYGKLGNGKTEDCATPEKIMDNVIDVSLGDYHSAAVTTDGRLWTWGGDYDGRLGNGEDYMDSYVPTPIMDNVESVSLGVLQSAAITRDGNLWMWGGGILGTGTVNEPSGIPIKILENVKSVYLSDTNLPCSAAILEDGSLWTWGDNNAGRLGQGTPPGKYYPVDSYVPVKILDNITDFCWGDHYGAAISNDGSLWVMGYSGDVLWDIEYVDRDVPTNAMSGVSDISIGNFNCIAIMEDGNIYTWGSNYSGQLGVGKTYSELKESDTLINIMDQFNS